MMVAAFSSDHPLFVGKEEIGLYKIPHLPVANLARNGGFLAFAEQE
jgi:hypothetical protein